MKCDNCGDELDQEGNSWYGFSHKDAIGDNGLPLKFCSIKCRDNFLEEMENE